mgnify:CR=1 FL=1
MKVAIDISRVTLSQVRALQRTERVALRDLIEEGLNLVISRRAAPERVRLHLPVVKGSGLTAEARRLGIRGVLELAATGDIDRLADVPDTP